MAIDNTDLDDLAARSARAQDGMKVNWDKYVRDTQRVVQELRNWRAAHDRRQAQHKADKPQPSGFEGAFADIFGGLRK
ncbi:hypothetical protein [Comamonas antarctica]|uniref:hypothetical protein n=1 Tax=Comamonas antarctica TaxID=2743470 RepID=UPI0028E63E41|nr:hypothetical protein [Comamonas antarctica]